MGQHATVDERMVLAGMEAYMYKHQSDLDRRIAFAWEAHDAPRILAEQSKTPWACVVEASTQMECICNGRWEGLTEELLQFQVRHFLPHHPVEEMPHSSVVRAAMQEALQEVCAMKTNIFIYGPRWAGKSHVLKPLLTFFGDKAFTRSVGASNYRLQDIFGKKVVVLQDVRMSTYKMSFDSLLVRWEGESVRVPRPQNVHQGDRLYDEGAFLFASAGAKLRISAEEAFANRVDAAEQNDMMDRRWRYFLHPETVPGSQNVRPCGRCFSMWLCRESEPTSGVI